MGRFTRERRRILVGLMPVVLVLVACTGATGLSGQAGVAAPTNVIASSEAFDRAADLSGEAGVTAPQEEPTAVVNLQERDAFPSDESAGWLTINVDITDDGIEPASIFIPVGRRVQLVLRNRGTTEHHYRVVGLVPEDLLWLAREATAEEQALVAAGAVTEDEHAAHHQAASVVPYRSASPAGIQPTGNEVHAYAAAGDMDVVFFTATNIGTFIVQDPLHPEIVGKVRVF
ncbi:MAG: cupredoxin domain-containing protein [Ardenticatenaceae bacterium]|nr:cupredoxin domain-containing protein [Ardenticatenaceae bacterium]